MRTVYRQLSEDRVNDVDPRPPQPWHIWLREEAAKPTDLSDLEGEAALRTELLRLRRLFRTAMTPLPNTIKSCLDDKKWDRAVELVKLHTREHPEAAKHYAGHVATELIQAREYAQAVEMHAWVGRWDEAHSVASAHLSKSDRASLFIKQAQHLEAAGQLDQAEQLYLKGAEPSLAVSMYNKARKYDQMIRVVSVHQPDLLQKTHLNLAHILEMTEDLREAEKHYVEAGEWQSAVNMFRANDEWDDAVRVAKANGGRDAESRVYCAWAMCIGGDEGRALLVDNGQVEVAIEYSVERRHFDFARDLARTSKQILDVYWKQGLDLEDEEYFEAAEEAFILAGKPWEAIEMYLHQEDGDNAKRVTEHYASPSLPNTLTKMASSHESKRQFASAERCLVQAHRLEAALRMYKESKQWEEAVRFCTQYLPHELASTLSAKNGSEDHAEADPTDDAAKVVAAPVSVPWSWRAFNDPEPGDYKEKLYRGALPEECLSIVRKHLQSPNEVLHASSGRTALHMAAEAGQVATVQWLVQQEGILVDARSKHGQTAVWMATWYGHPDCLSVLVEAGADINISDARNATAQGLQHSPFAAAVDLHRIECARILGKAGVHVDCRQLHCVYGEEMIRTIEDAVMGSPSAVCACSHRDSCVVQAGIEVRWLAT